MLTEYIEEAFPKPQMYSTDPYKRAVYCILGATDINDEHSGMGLLKKRERTISY